MGKVGVPLLALGVDRQVTKRDTKGRDGLLSVRRIPPVLGAGLNGRLLCLGEDCGCGGWPTQLEVKCRPCPPAPARAGPGTAAICTPGLGQPLLQISFREH